MLQPDATSQARDLVAALARTIVGQQAAAEALVAGYLAGGHVLLEGVPGVGKTLLARAFAAATSLRFRPAAAKAAICAAVEADVWPMLADGRVRLSPETRIPFEEVREAHRLLASGDNVGKIVLVH